MRVLFVIFLLWTRCTYSSEQLNQKLQKQLNGLFNTNPAKVNTKRIQQIMELISQGANPNWASQYGHIRILHLMSGIGNTHVIKWLLDHNANPQLTDIRGWNAFTYTRFIDNPDKRKTVVELLYTSSVAPSRRQTSL